jgi:hypothetical protein
VVKCDPKIKDRSHTAVMGSKELSEERMIGLESNSGNCISANLI